MGCFSLNDEKVKLCDIITSLDVRDVALENDATPLVHTEYPSTGPIILERMIFLNVSLIGWSFLATMKSAVETSLVFEPLFSPHFLSSHLASSCCITYQS